MSDGMMDSGPTFNGKKFLISVVVGLILFTLVSMFITFGIGRIWGNLLNKKALDNEREIQSQEMKRKESARNQ
ncbi:MAG: hypothetical protein JST12_20015 [Armatimonadetes bacterium]|nr:hypothetical protein [Armatimonadota bacterium]MBS1703961.1 hypothetical protein [Armatimonadota bacterium]